MVDEEDKKGLIGVMRDEWMNQVYSAEEEALIKQVCHMLEGSLKEESWVRVQSIDPLVKMESNHYHKNGTAIGRANAVVDASIEECAAWEFAKMSRERYKAHYDGGGTDRDVIKLTEHSDLFRIVLDLKIPSIDTREFLTRSCWRMVDENTMVCAYENAEDVRFPRKKHVRASTDSFFRYEKLPEVEGIPQTKVTYCIQVDLKGFIPKTIMNSKIVWTMR